MFTVLVLAYTVWAIYSGYEVITGRSEWLDKKAPINTIVKYVLVLVVGYVIGAFYLVYLLLRFLGFMSKQ